MKITKPLLLLILIIGLSLRLISLNQSLWLDEAINVRAATQFGPLYLITNYALGDFHPPFYHIVLHYWIKLFGQRELWVRLPSVIFGLITIVYTYYLSLKLFSQQKFNIWGREIEWANVPALLLATSGLHIYYSQEARMYSFAAMATVMSVYYAYRQTPKKDIWSLTKYGNYLKHMTHSFHQPNSYCLILSLWLLLMADYVPYLLLPLFIVLVPWQTLAALILSGWWWPLFMIQLNQGLTTASDYPLWGQVVGGLSVKNIALIPVKFLIGRINLQPQWLYGLSMLVLVSLSGWLIYKGIKSVWKTKTNLAQFLIIGWLVLALGLGIVLSSQISLLSYFRFLFVLPVFYILITAGLTKLSRRLVKVVLLVWLCLNLISSGVYLSNPQYQREDWRQFSNWIDSQDQPLAVTVFPNLAQADPYLYYQDEVPAVETLDNLEMLPEAIYLVRYVQEIFDPQDSLRDQIEELGFILIEQKNFNGVVVWHYQPNQRLFASLSESD